MYSGGDRPPAHSIKGKNKGMNRGYHLGLGQQPPPGEESMDWTHAGMAHLAAPVLPGS